MMENAYLPKISILMQFGGEILALLCPGDSIQILLILSQFLTFGSETKLEAVGKNVPSAMLLCRGFFISLKSA